MGVQSELRTHTKWARAVMAALVGLVMTLALGIGSLGGAQEAYAADTLTTIENSAVPSASTSTELLQNPDFSSTTGWSADQANGVEIQGLSAFKLMTAGFPTQPSYANYSADKVLEL